MNVLVADIGSLLTLAVIGGVVYLLLKRERRRRQVISLGGLGGGGFLLGVIVGCLINRRGRKW